MEKIGLHKKRRELAKRGGNFFNIRRYEMSSLFAAKLLKMARYENVILLEQHHQRVTK